MRLLPSIPPVVAAFLLSALAPVAADAPDPVREEVRVDVVNLAVVVTDRQGNPVRDLSKEDFTVLEDGKRVAITNFRPAAAAPSTVSPTEPPAGATATGSGAAVPAGDPIHIVVFVDSLNIHPMHRNLVFEKLRGYLLEEIDSGVPVMLVTNGPRIEIVQEFTTDRDALAERLHGLRSELPVRLPGAGATESHLEAVYDSLESLRDCVEQPRCNGEAILQTAISQIRAFSHASYDQNEVLLQNLGHLLASLGAMPGRKSLVYVSDGFPLNPGQDLHRALREGIEKERQKMVVNSGAAPGAGQNSGSSAVAGANARRKMMQLQRLLEIADRSSGGNAPTSLSGALEQAAASANSNDIRIYSIQAEAISSGAVGADASSRDAEIISLSTATRLKEFNYKAPLELMADSTGGRAVRGSIKTGRMLETILRDAANQYSIGFRSDRAGDGKIHKIKVKVKGRGLKVRCPRSYVGRNRSVRRSEQLLAALFLERGDNAHQLSVHVGEATRDGLLRLTAPILVNVPVRHMALEDRGEVHAADLTVLVGTRDVRGAITSLREFPVPVEIPDARVADAREQVFPIRLTVPARPGKNTVVVGLWDGDSTVPSFAGGVFEPGDVPK